MLQKKFEMLSRIQNPLVKLDCGKGEALRQYLLGAKI